MPFTAPPSPLAPPALTLVTPFGPVPMRDGWDRWCVPSADLPAELRTGADPVCGYRSPDPVPMGLGTPFRSCDARLAPAFTATAAPGERIAVEGFTPSLGEVTISAAQGGAVRILPAGETTLLPSGPGPTEVVVAGSGPHGDVTYRATVGVVTDHRLPSARINVRHRSRVIEITLRRPARISVCIRTPAERADRSVPLDLGVRPTGTTRLRLGPRAWQVALGLATPEGLTRGPAFIEIIRPRA